MDIACLAIAALKDLKIDCLQLFYLLREIRSSGPESFLCFVYILTLQQAQKISKGGDFLIN